MRVDSLSPSLSLVSLSLSPSFINSLALSLYPHPCLLSFTLRVCLVAIPPPPPPHPSPLQTTKKDLQTSRQEFERLIGLAQEGENFILACVDDVKRTATARGLMSTGDAAFPGGVDGLPDAATARGGGQQASTLSALQLDERQKVLDMLLTKLSNFNKHVKIYQGREMQGLPHISAPQPPSMSRNSSRGSGGGGSRTPRGGGAAPFGGGRSTPLGPAGLGGTGAHTARAGTMGFPRR